jgi:hypothetical protein
MIHHPLTKWCGLCDPDSSQVVEGVTCVTQMDHTLGSVTQMHHTVWKGVTCVIQMHHSLWGV